MSGMIKVENWGKIISSFQQGGVPLPFVKEIFLIESRIAGTSHVEAIKEKTDTLTQGTLVAFRREPSNPYDTLAIQILNEVGERIGYVPKAQNEVLARLMDGGKLLFGKVEKKTERKGWIAIDIKVYMRDL